RTPGGAVLPCTALFRSELEAMGPTFVKLGQMLSTRPDIVPPAYAEALERMQEDVAAVDFALVREQVEAELGVRISKAFIDFEERSEEHTSELQSREKRV